MALVAVRIRRGNAFTICALEENGTCKLLEFLAGVPEKEWSVLARSLEHIANIGQLRNPEMSKLVDDKLFELRTPGGLRVFYFYDAGRLVICTNGYIKKKQRLNPAEIDKAKIWRIKYFNAKAVNTLEFKDDLI